MHFPQKCRLKDKRMAENQNNPDPDRIEPWLEAYAQNRRKELDEPIELDEATRTMLQGEVERVYPKKQVETSAPVETGMPTWLPWVMGGAVCTLALVATLDSNPVSKSKPMEMAKVDPATKPAAEGSTESREDSNLGGRDISSKNGTSSISAHAIPEVDKESASATALIEPKKVSPPRPVPAPRLVNAPKAMALKESNRRVARYNNLADMAQNFVQEPAGKSGPKAKQLPEPILVDFQIERTGNLIMVKDRDGSVYTGNVISEEKFAASPSALKLSVASRAPAQRERAPGGAVAGGLAPAAIAPGENATPALTKPARQISAISRPIEGQFFFRVQGTNQTLRKLVVFEATLDGMPGQANKWQYQGALRQPMRSGQVVPQKNLKSAKDENELSKRAETRRVHAVQLLRVQGNARIGKANYRLDAYQTPSGSYRPADKAKAVAPAPKK